MFKNHPIGLRVLFFTEMWERFGYYLILGILSIIVGYLLLQGSTFARVIGIAMVCLNLIAQFAYLPLYPFWGIIGIAVSFFPYIIPPEITIWEAAAAPESQLFLLYGLIPILPIILGYTALTYYVFRGRVREGDGYH